MVGDGRVRAVTGSAVVGLSELVRSFREAEVVLALGAAGADLEVGVESLGVSGLLMLLVATAFVMRWRTLLVSAVAVAASMLTALGVLYLTGETINALVVAGPRRKGQRHRRLV